MREFANDEGHNPEGFVSPISRADEPRRDNRLINCAYKRID